MIARVVLVAVAIAATGTGVGFCGVAIYLLVAPVVGAPAGAALTALTLFLAVGAGTAVHFLLARGPATALPPPVAARSQSQDALITALTQLAKEHPLMAVGCAAALGLTATLNRRAG